MPDMGGLVWVDFADHLNIDGSTVGGTALGNTKESSCCDRTLSHWWPSAGEADPAELGEGPAFVEDVVVEDRSGEYWAMAMGFYPDACSTYGGSEQQVDGSTIVLTVTSTRPEDVARAQALTDMTEEILLDTDGLAPGRYEVVANQGRSTRSSRSASRRLQQRWQSASDIGVPA